VDLGRWLNESYTVPVVEMDDVALSAADLQALGLPDADI
jgi:endogenous inhibitor of DNA gyrase (YacG/DUF329 family)